MRIFAICENARARMPRKLSHLAKWSKSIGPFSFEFHGWRRKANILHVKRTMSFLRNASPLYARLRVTACNNHEAEWLVSARLEETGSHMTCTVVPFFFHRKFFMISSRYEVLRSFLFFYLVDARFPSRGFCFRQLRSRASSRWGLLKLAPFARYGGETSIFVVSRSVVTRLKL